MTAPERDRQATLARIAAALERLSPSAVPDADPCAGSAFVWEARSLRGVPGPAAQPLDLLQGIDPQKAALLGNCERLARGLPAHDVLLWGSRGMGKSALIKSVHAHLRTVGHDIALVQVHRDDTSTLPALFDRLRRLDRRFILFCDDLSFEADEQQYKALRSVLEGGIESRPDNCRIVVTSNRRHLVSRDGVENEAATAINPRDVVDDRLALADRFGLSLGFHNCDQPTYLTIVHGYADHHRLPIAPTDLEHEALAWSMARGARSGRVAWQFIQETAGRLEVQLR